jgi:decaprenyl-phosphate phosphoribosyltransferase
MNSGKAGGVAPGGPAWPAAPLQAAVSVMLEADRPCPTRRHSPFCPPPMRLLFSLVTLMRPHQWLKNVFVFAGLMFSERWNDGPLALTVLNAFAAFCCFSSVVYILNDWHDRAADVRHPVKRKRPLASGAVSPAAALGLAALLLAIGLGLAAGNLKLLVLLGLYLALNLAYSWGLKHVPVVDVTIIASGFMLRLLAGTLAVGIPPSRWMLLAGLFVALFLGFSKRKAESFHDEADQRAVLEHYPPALLDIFMAVTMTASLMTYGLFAVSADSQRQHGDRLFFTVPIVVFALLRYGYQVHRGRGEDVSRDLLRDPWILVALAAWLVVFVGHRF